MFSTERAFVREKRACDGIFTALSVRQNVGGLSQAVSQPA